MLVMVRWLGPGASLSFFREGMSYFQRFNDLNEGQMSLFLKAEVARHLVPRYRNIRIGQVRSQAGTQYGALVFSAVLWTAKRYDGLPKKKIAARI